MVGIGWTCDRIGRRVGRHLAPVFLARQMSVLFFVAATLVYFALPGDWMGEYRFATPMFVFGPAAVVCVLGDVAIRRRAPRYIIATHIRKALAFGATEQRILEAIEVLMPEAGRTIFEEALLAWDEVVSRTPTKRQEG